MVQIDTSGLYILVCGIILSLFWGYEAQKQRDLARRLNNGKRKAIITRKAVILMVLSCLGMWLPSALRYNVGLDNANYLMQFNYMTTLSDAFSYYEPGFGLLCYFCKSVFNSFQTLIFITALLTGGLMWKCIYRYSNSIVLCILGFIAVNMYFMSFTVIRQFIAIAILMNTIEYIKNKKLTKFLIWWVLAVSFHYTASLFIVLYFVYSDSGKLITWKNAMILLATVIFFYSINNVIGSVFSAVGTLREGYSSYEGGESIKDIKELVFLLPYPILFLVCRNYFEHINKFLNVLFWILVLLILTKAIGIMFPYLSRMHYYFIFGGPLLVSFSTKFNNNGYRLFVPICFSVYYLWSIYNIYKYQWDDFLPFYTIFSE